MTASKSVLRFIRDYLDVLLTKKCVSLSLYKRVFEVVSAVERPPKYLKYLTRCALKLIVGFKEYRMRRFLRCIYDHYMCDDDSYVSYVSDATKMRVKRCFENKKTSLDIIEKRLTKACDELLHRMADDVAADDANDADDADAKMEAAESKHSLDEFEREMKLADANVNYMPAFSNFREKFYAFALSCAKPAVEMIFPRRYDDRAVRPRAYVVCSSVQSGKTKVMLALAQASLCRGETPVILVQNYRKDYEQLQERIRMFSDERRQFCKNECKDDPEDVPSLKVRFVGRKKKSNIKKITKVLSADTNTKTILVCLANHCEINRLNQLISDANAKYILIIDEADANYKSPTTAFKRAADKLYKKSTAEIAVSATSLDIVVKEAQLTNRHIIMLPRRANYKGISDMMMRTVSAPAMRRGHYDVTRDPNVRPLYERLGQLEPFKFMDTKHPIICLHKTSVFMSDQFATQQYLRDNATFAQWTSIVYNGNGVRLYNQELAAKSTVEIAEVKSTKSGDYHTFKGVLISDVLQYLKDNIAATAEHIAIISGKVADRGTSFVSADFKWHLTHEYLIMPHSTTVSNLVQSLRLCGIYQDTVPIELISTDAIINDCAKYERIQQRMIEESRHHRTSIKMHDFLQFNHKVGVSQMPEHKLSKHKEYKRLIRTYDDSKVAVADDDSDDSDDEKRPSANGAGIIERFKELVLDDLSKGRQTAKVRLLQFFKTHKSGTSAEIERICGVSVNPNHDKWNTKHNCYKIAVKDATNMYVINPEIADILNNL